MAARPISNAKKKKSYSDALVQGKRILAEIFSEAVGDPNALDSGPPSIVFLVDESGHVNTYPEETQMGQDARRLYDAINAITKDEDATGRAIIELYGNRHPERPLPAHDPEKPMHYRITFRHEDLTP